MKVVPKHFGIGLGGTEPIPVYFDCSGHFDPNSA